VLFATCLTTESAALWQWQAPAMYEVLAVEAGLAAPGADFLERGLLWLKVQTIAELFFYTTLAAVKFAFLVFLKRRGRHVHRFNWLWWPVVTLILVFYVLCIGTVGYRCAHPEDLEGYCSARSADDTLAVLMVTCVLDVVSDFLSTNRSLQALLCLANHAVVLLLSVLLFQNIQLAFAKKLALLGSFVLALGTIAIAIARATETSLMDLSYRWLWTTIEPCMAITVLCLFASLVGGSFQAQKSAYKPTASYRGRKQERGVTPRVHMIPWGLDTKVG
jgi:hypothetical protein